MAVLTLDIDETLAQPFKPLGMGARSSSRCGLNGDGVILEVEYQICGFRPPRFFAHAQGVTLQTIFIVILPAIHQGFVGPSVGRPSP